MARTSCRLRSSSLGSKKRVEVEWDFQGFLGGFLRFFLKNSRKIGFFYGFLGVSRVLYGVFLRFSKVFLRFFWEKRGGVGFLGFLGFFKGFVWGFLKGF